MAEVTVGVPVYNGAAFLEKCLTCLRDQTYRDIEVLIFDNCSEDATPEIAKRFCDADPRFRYHRQPENKGAMRNFREVLEAAKTPFFMWRAHDDTSDLNYIETLLTLLLEHPERDVAVPRVVSSFPDGRIKRVCNVSRLIGKGTEIDRLAQLFLTHESWIYGLHRREVLTPILHEIIADYPYNWGMDNLALFVLGFDGKIIGSNATTFYQYRRQPNPAMRRATLEYKIERGQFFAAFAHRQVNRRIANPVKRWINHIVVASFVHLRALSFSKRLRQRFYHSWSFAKISN
jgi:glycosyltransferase involved in cell wall biosynthesis